MRKLMKTRNRQKPANFEVLNTIHQVALVGSGLIIAALALADETELASDFGAGVLIASLNFWVMSALLERTLVRRRRALLSGLLYFARMFALMGVTLIVFRVFEPTPVAFVAGLMSVLGGATVWALSRALLSPEVNS